jgi:hypothetical protein
MTTYSYKHKYDTTEEETFISFDYRDRAYSVRHDLGKHKVLYYAEDTREIMAMKFQEACGVSREARHRGIDNIEKERLSL